MRSKKWYAVAGGLAVAGITAVALMVGNSVGAQELPFTIDPPEPEPGEQFEVSGECFGFRNEDGSQAAGTSVDVFLTDYRPATHLDAFANHIQHARQDAPDDLPEPVFPWSVTLRMPPDAVPEQDTFYVSVYCLHPGSFNFDSGSFGVGSPDLPTTTTTTTSPPPASDGSAGEGGGASAQGQATQPAQTGPAAPVEAEPTFTG
jgi:hypothetical protein